LQSLRPVRRVAELGSLGITTLLCMTRFSEFSKIASKVACRTLTGVIGGVHTLRRSRRSATASPFSGSSAEVLERQSPFSKRTTSLHSHAPVTVAVVVSRCSRRFPARLRLRRFVRLPSPVSSKDESTSFVTAGYIPDSIALMVALRFSGISRETTMMPNHALQRTRRERRGCNHCVPCAGSLSLGR
jgi:hypothetical protein